MIAQRSRMKGVLAIVTLLIGLPVAAQEATFPQLSGETADGRAVRIPGLSGGGHTVIGIAYGKKAQPLLEEWYEPAYLRFVARHGLFASAHDAQVYFVPLFVGLNKAAYEPSLKRFRKSASPEIVDHVVFSREDLDRAGSLGMKDPTIPYFFVVNGEGRIVHRTQGAYTPEKLDALEEVLLEKR